MAPDIPKFQDNAEGWLSSYHKWCLPPQENLPPMLHLFW